MDSRYLELTYDLLCQQLKDDCFDLDADKPCSEEYLGSIITRYQNLIEQFKLLPDVSSDHYLQLSNISHLLAMYYFNRSIFLDAANFYLCTIQWLEHVECTAEDFRKIVRRSLDLAECYVYIARKDLAQKAINFAIKAFNSIDFLLKTSEEEEIDPARDFSTFYYHYQTESSSTKHLNSTEFKNNATLINLMIEKNAADKQMEEAENAIMQLSLHSPQDKEEDIDLSNMLNTITLDHEAILKGELLQLDSSFLDEDATRKQIGEYLKLALQHRDKHDTRRQMETYDQILDLYNLLAAKTPTDLGVIRSLTEQKQKYLHSSQPTNLFYFAPQSGASSSAPSNKMDLS